MISLSPLLQLQTVMLVLVLFLGITLVTRPHRFLNLLFVESAVYAVNALASFLLSVAMLDKSQGGFGVESGGHVAMLGVVAVMQGVLILWILASMIVPLVIRMSSGGL